MRRHSASLLLPLVLAACGGTTKTAPDLATSADLVAPADLVTPSDLAVVDFVIPLLPLGAACTDQLSCLSGLCTDGVCCDTPCGGTCQTCAAPGNVGHCSSVPDGTDPARECTGAPVFRADGGLGDGGDFSNVDGGTYLQLSACAGACNGKGACVFPDAKTACGPDYCAEVGEAGGFECDGAGGCNLVRVPCGGNVCVSGKCEEGCNEPSDCLPGSYCNGVTSQCAEEKANGLLCSVAYECQSDVCAGGVCCNQACDAPGSCTDSGHEGECRCGGKVCASGKACVLAYRDLDEDTFGDQFGTLESFTARAICEGDAPPTGFVLDHTDCDDFDARAKPGQTDWYDQPSLGRGIFDYNCDGGEQKETREHESSVCKFCNGTPPACASGSTCPSNGQQAVLTCESSVTICSVYPFIQFCSVCGWGLFSSSQAGFYYPVDCGASGTFRTCGTCSAQNGGVTGTTDATKVQRCH